MEQYCVIGKSIPKKEGWDKVTGRVKYIDDKQEIGTLHVKLFDKRLCACLPRSD
ncbi:hypothetical protein GCM10020331_100710 [Ectobacillus funiculus]